MKNYEDKNIPASVKSLADNQIDLIQRFALEAQLMRVPCIAAAYESGAERYIVYGEPTKVARHIVHLPFTEFFAPFVINNVSNIFDKKNRESKSLGDAEAVRAQMNNVILNMNSVPLNNIISV